MQGVTNMRYESICVFNGTHLPHSKVNTNWWTWTHSWREANTFVKYCTMDLPLLVGLQISATQSHTCTLQTLPETRCSFHLAALILCLWLLATCACEWTCEHSCAQQNELNIHVCNVYTCTCMYTLAELCIQISFTVWVQKIHHAAVVWSDDSTTTVEWS